MQWKYNLSSFIKDIHNPVSFNLTNFNAASVTAFRSAVIRAEELQQNIFPINVESVGGDGYSMCGFLSIMDQGKKAGLKFLTSCSSCAFSAGAIIFAYGDEGLRFVGTESQVMFHNMSILPDGNAAKIQNAHMDMNYHLELDNKIFAKISKHLKKKSDWFNKELKKIGHGDWFLSPEECLKHNIANHIGVPTMTLKTVSEIGVEV